MPVIVILLFFIILFVFILTIAKIGLFSDIAEFFVKEDSDLDIDKKRKEYIDALEETEEEIFKLERKKNELKEKLRKHKNRK